LFHPGDATMKVSGLFFAITTQEHSLAERDK